MLNAGSDVFRLVVAVLVVKEQEGEASARSDNKVGSGDSSCVRVTDWGVPDFSTFFNFSALSQILLQCPWPNQEKSVADVSSMLNFFKPIYYIQFLFTRDTLSHFFSLLRLH
jgi:hypothetical protein